MTAATSSRILTLLSLLQTRRDWSGHELAERLDVTPRTVRRDIERLRELEYRIETWKGPSGGYRLAAGSELPPLRFDDEQAVAIAVALRGAPALGVDIEEAAARALETVRQVMPSRLRHRVDGIQFTGAAVARPVERVDPAVLGIVSLAARERRTLRFDYASSVHPPTSGAGASRTATASATASANTPPPPRQVEPHAVIAHSGRWYLVAWNLDVGEWRIYRLDRIAPRTPWGVPFAERPIPTGDAGTFLAARFKGSSAQDRWPCIGELVLHVPAAEATMWLPEAPITPIDDVSCRVSLGSWSWTGMLASVLRFDAPFEVVGPPELAQAAATLADRLRSASDAVGGPASVSTAIGSPGGD